ncbi:MAG: 16S rRNA (guanine(966)-N(2))-methyltransferase RsmD [Ruminococcus sp.]|nr:16S rRNA (guanine(966)-N(2))-methyltransferase RsmD [Ruminococcus sp.]
MRVITGTARGKKLKTLDGLEVRPTSDKVKEAIFSIIQFDVPAASVLDLFSGSGQLGIEALSRGAEHCVFVDKSKASLDITRENISSCGFLDRSRILNLDSLEYLSVGKKGIDIALLDPPYHQDILPRCLEKIERLLNDEAIVVCEHESELILPEKFGRLELSKRYRYGKIALSVYRLQTCEE